MPTSLGMCRLVPPPGQWSSGGEVVEPLDVPLDASPRSLSQRTSTGGVLTGVLGAEGTFWLQESNELDREPLASVTMETPWLAVPTDNSLIAGSQPSRLLMTCCGASVATE